ncbi:LLM class F420-dependent oxidoreductase [Streptomyces boncukensis]|uniref:LLM class F420-dependent oxidoreductase n=1 Tax=Streptomyces boncukensis TaxID=2711219 RepID=A0A6G4X1R0_9ACTN|nr:LLM class F420-dependent oxidoreductase [Streptomyces boncukensis]NGO70684.1 LLM class F420-dependent oxidoreductase [Streptomyces boncukensis]
MRIGIATFVTDEGIRPDTLARAAEERGFDSLFLAEHSHIPQGATATDGSPIPHRFHRSLDPFLALTAAATATERLLLGTGVALLIQRDVIHTAKEVATLDLLSGGRAILAVGAGWNRPEMRNHGTDPRTRGRLLDEQLAALKAIWTRETAAYDGDFVRFGPLHMWPKPVQRPHPPLYIGGNGAAARARVAEAGDGWFPTEVSPAELRTVRAWLADRGRGGAVLNAPADPSRPEELNRYAEAGADRATFQLETLPEAETLRRLDELAAVAADYLA